MHGVYNLRQDDTEFCIEADPGDLGGATITEIASEHSAYDAA